MGFIFLIIMAVISFGCFILGYKYFKKDALYVLAIGGAVAANIFNIGNFPIYVGNLVFGLDSVIYTLFIFCIAVLIMDYGKKDALSLTYTALASILFAGIVQFIASWATNGIEYGVVWGIISFITSIVATYLAVISVIAFYKWAHKKINKYLMMGIIIFIASIINSAVYFGVVAIFTGGFGNNFVGVLAGSYIGKGMCILFSVAAYYLTNRKSKTEKTKIPETNKQK